MSLLLLQIEMFSFVLEMRQLKIREVSNMPRVTQRGSMGLIFEPRSDFKVPAHIHAALEGVLLFGFSQAG